MPQRERRQSVMRHESGNLTGETAVRSKRPRSSDRGGSASRVLDYLDRVVDLRKPFSHGAAARNSERRQTEGMRVIPPFDPVGRASECKHVLARISQALRDQTVK